MIEYEIEEEIDVIVAIDENNNEIENDDMNAPNLHNRERKIVKKPWPIMKKTVRLHPI